MKDKFVIPQLFDDTLFRLWCFMESNTPLFNCFMSWRGVSSKNPNLFLLEFWLAYIRSDTALRCSWSQTSSAPCSKQGQSTFQVRQLAIEQEVRDQPETIRTARSRDASSPIRDPIGGSICPAHVRGSSALLVVRFNPSNRGIPWSENLERTNPKILIHDYGLPLFLMKP